MNNSRPNFFDRITGGLPIAFPLVGLAHFAWLILAIRDYRTEPFPSPIWTQVGWLAAYTLSWLLSARGLRAGAWAYNGLTALNILLRFFLKDASALSSYTDALFPFDVLFCFFLLLYYKRLR